MFAQKFKISGRFTPLFLSVLLTSCSILGIGPPPTPTPIQDPSLIDETLITGEPCLPPCWHGIEVGITTKEEAIQIASNLSFVDKDSLWQGETRFPPAELEEIPSWAVVFDCKQPENLSCVRMYFVDDILILITLLPNYRITVAGVSNLLGEPDLLSIFPGGRYSEQQCRGNVIWLKHQVKIYFGENPDTSRRRLCRIITNNDDKLPKDTPIVFISILTEENAETLSSLYGKWTGFIEP
jgi:hypothetical protein